MKEKWLSLGDNMSNSETLCSNCVINVCLQPFGCSPMKVEKLFTFSKIGNLASQGNSK